MAQDVDITYNKQKISYTFIDLLVVTFISFIVPNYLE